jgi:hypothetical protein
MRMGVLEHLGIAQAPAGLFTAELRVRTVIRLLTAFKPCRSAGQPPAVYQSSHFRRPQPHLRSQHRMYMISFSILDLSPIRQGASTTEALRNSLDLAQHAESWGYHRVWLAEHHNMPGIASAATSIVIGYVAGETKTVRVGSGGIMLPNHSPLVIAEQFGTLASLYPDRIDLGLGRAPGTDVLTARALRRDMASSSDRFPQDVEELQSYFAPVTPYQKNSRCSRCRITCTHLVARVKPVQRATCS